MRKAAFYLSIVLVVSCSPERGASIHQVQIVTKDPGRMTHWYRENFGFDVHKNELSLSGFKILLKKNEEAVSTDSLREVFQLQHIPGFFKLGFISNQFDALVKRLKENDVHFVSNIIFDQDIKRITLIIADPDGNQIQLFEGFGRNRLNPYYLAVIVESIGEQEKWYQMKLPIKKTYNRDSPDMNLFVRLLEGEGFLIELINTSGKSVKKELDQYERLGFNLVTVSGANTPFEHDHEGNLIVHQ